MQSILGKREACSPLDKFRQSSGDRTAVAPELLRVSTLGVHRLEHFLPCHRTGACRANLFPMCFHGRDTWSHPTLACQRRRRRQRRSRDIWGSVPARRACCSIVSGIVHSEFGWYSTLKLRKSGAHMAATHDHARGRVARPLPVGGLWGVAAEHEWHGAACKSATAAPGVSWTRTAPQCQSHSLLSTQEAGTTRASGASGRWTAKVIASSVQ